MPYIKLLTILAGLALLTACGGGTAETPDTAGGNATDCETNAFHADCEAIESAIKLRQSMCLNDTDIHSTCGGVIANFCRTNPFQETACLPNDTYLPLRIAECITGGKADTPNCGLITRDATKNTTLTACLENPFDVACESVADFTTYALARTNRASFCDNSDNVANDLCTGDVVMPICGLDPFNAICFTGNTYRSPRITNCIMAGNAGDDKCDTIVSDTAMNTELTDCLTNPFATACESVTAFSSSFALARTNRLTFCNDNMNVANTLCMGESRMAICGSNPFNASCLTDKTYLPMRLADCITTASTEAEKCNTLLSDSTMNTAITACLTNPFTPACEADSDFTTYAETAQMNRESFCGVSGNESKDPCTALTACQGNPFGAGCGEYFAPARITDCITVASTEATKCDNIFSDSTTNTAITACLTNPFSDTCEASESAFTTYAEMARENRVTFCEANTGNALCMDTNLMSVCTFDPFSPLCTSGNYLTTRQTQCVILITTNTNCSTILSGIIDPTDLPNYATMPTDFTGLANTATPGHGFLRIDDEEVFNTMDLRNTAVSLSESTTFETRRGAENTGLDGYNVRFGTRGYFVGIIPTTDLGAPLTVGMGQQADAEWVGRYTLTAHTAEAGNAITFDINFVTGELTGTAPITGFGYDITINTTFGATGVMTGTLSINSSLNPTNAEDTTVTGLIGTEGLVGIFHGGSMGNSAFAGGFVADAPPPPNPCIALTTCVDTGDLETYPSKPNEITLSGFLTATEAGLNMTDISNEGFATRMVATDPAPFTGRRGGADSTNPDGFAYFVTTDETDNPASVSYAGILPTTNLGAPLPSTTASAVWEGHFSIAGVTNQSVDFYVNFSTGRFGFSNAGRDGFGTFDHDNLDRTYTMNAHFGSHASANGYPAGRMGGTLAVSGVNSVLHPTIVGLIGEEGAVGVFTQVGGATRTVGGFTATNPAYTPPE